MRLHATLIIPASEVPSYGVAVAESDIFLVLFYLKEIEAHAQRTECQRVEKQRPTRADRYHSLFQHAQQKKGDYRNVNRSDTNTNISSYFFLGFGSGTENIKFTR